MPTLSSIFSLFFWFQLHPGDPSVSFWILTGLYVVGLGGSAYYVVDVRRRFADHAYRMAIAKRVGLSAGLLSGFGIVFAILRFFSIPVLSVRFWELIITVGAIGLGAFLVYYYLRMFPSSLQAFEARLLRERYLPKPKAKSYSRPAGATKRRRRGK